jgi:hypothetical protein
VTAKGEVGPQYRGDFNVLEGLLESDGSRCGFSSSKNRFSYNSTQIIDQHGD